MKKCLYLPVIDENDFKSFKSIMHHEINPPTHQVWLQGHADRIAHYRSTHKVIEVDVNPDEFEGYLSERSRGANMESLLAFAEFVGKRRKK